MPSVRTARGSIVALLAVVFMATTTRDADAQSKEQAKEQCLRAHETAQTLRRQGKLRSAREQILACMQDSCPSLIRAECSKLLEQVETSTPTIVFEGRGVKGEPTTAVRVVLDGTAVLERLDGRALPVDPGEHTVRFESSAGTRETKIVVPEGQKNRTVLADFEDHERKAPAPASSPAELARLERVEAARSQRTIGFIVAGVGLASLTVGAVSGILALDAANDATCAAPCPARDPSGAPGAKIAKADSAYDQANTLAWVSNVTLAVGAVGLAIGGYLVFTARQPKGDALRGPPPRTGVLAPVPLRDGAALSWVGTL